MITKINFDSSFFEENIFLARIKANSLCYGKFQFCNSFEQRAENDETTAFINILSGNATAFLTEKADKNELKEFLNFNGVNSVFCNVDLGGFENGIVLKFKGNTTAYYPKTAYPDYKFIYNLLVNEFTLPSYNNFVSDISFRISRECATVVCSETACCFTLWETEKTAVISAVVTDRKRRKKGEGSKALQSLCKHLKHKDIFVFCKENLANFYLKNGFEITDNFFTGEIKI